ncbi:hypothetical protein CRM22_009562 [Opisthorchis felineus]|uniref:Fas-binding factor 1 C-terminal domain-containing protein n=1 Tax=Opisthorchis felineus TaxID=147828 RepID=A0A4S2L6B6_OPIFE|nr:hypothetical protein CRM22_009562 [Opisthorchis felineus]
MKPAINLLNVKYRAETRPKLFCEPACFFHLVAGLVNPTKLLFICTVTRRTFLKMSTFYSDLANDAWDDIKFSDEKSQTHGGFHDDSLDDILNTIDMGDELEKTIHPSKLDTRVEGKSIAEKSMSGSKVSTGQKDDSGATKPQKHRMNARKNVLDLLMEPYDNSTSNTGKQSAPTTPFSLEEDEKRHGAQTKRSVRFSDIVDLDDSKTELQMFSDPSDVQPEKQKISGLATKSDRPYTAPGSRNEENFESDKSLFEDLFGSKSSPADSFSTLEAKNQSLRTKLRRPSSLDSIGKRSIADEVELPQDSLWEKRALSKIHTGNPREPDSSLKLTELQTKIKRLEMELSNSATMLQLLNKQHQEEVALVEQAAKSKLDLLEESAKRREHRLKEELRFLEEQNRERMITLESQRDQLIAELSTKLKDTRAQATQEVVQLKNLHEQELKTLKVSHEEAIARIQNARQNEFHVMNELQPNTENLKRLLEQLITTIAEIGKGEQERTRDLSVRQEQLTRREDALRKLESRLGQREEELERERKQITEVMGKLEFQLKENIKQMTEDRWAIKQEHNRLAKMQIMLEEERRGLVEQAGRERAELQQLVSNFLGEHRKSHEKNAEERRQITEENQRLRADQLAWEEQRRAEETRLRAEKESIDAAKQKLGAERRHLDEQVNKLRIDEVKLEETRRQLDIVRCDLVREQEELNERNRYLTEQATELARRSDTVSNSEKELTEAQLRLEKLKQEQNKGLAELQAREERLHESERKMNMALMMQNERLFYTVRFLSLENRNARKWRDSTQSSFNSVNRQTEGFLAFAPTVVSRFGNILPPL